MDLSYGSEYDVLRESVRAFLKEQWPPADDAASTPPAKWPG